MMLLVFIALIGSALLLSSLLIFAFIHSRYGLASRSSSAFSRQAIRYSIPPSMDIITRRLSSIRSTISHDSEAETKKCIQPRSQSLAHNLLVTRCTNRRRSTIIDPKVMAQIQFELPPTPEKFRRRSVAVCHNVLDTKRNTLDSLIKTIASSNRHHPCLVSFSIVHLKSSQLKIQFHSLTSLPPSVQQLTIKGKLNPDGRSKDLPIKNILPGEALFSDANNEHFIQFSHLPAGKLPEKSLTLKFHGKDQAKKHVHLGQVGRIQLGELPNIQHDIPIELTHEIENPKMSSVEVLVLLEHNQEHNLLVDIKRVKGLKVDQKQLDASGFFRVTLLDRHRPVTTLETKSYRLNSSTFALQCPLNFDISAFSCDNLERLMITIEFYSDVGEQQALGRVKLASPYVCSGTGTIHWQQLKERRAFSMWHTLCKL